MKNTNGIMPVNVSVWRAYLVYKSISDYITNKITDKTGINKEIFFVWQAYSVCFHIFIVYKA